MENGQKLALLGFGVAGVYFYRKTQATQFISANVNRVQNLSFSGSQIAFDIEVIIANTSQENLTVSGVGGFLFLNGSQIGVIQLNQPFTIQKFSDTVITIPARLNAFSAVYSLQQLIQLIKGSGVILKLDARARALALNIPIQSQIALKI